MCPSDIYQLPVSTNGFGASAEVFASDNQYPCSIAVKDEELGEQVKIQVQRDDVDTWIDYEQGELLIGKKIKCRIAYGGATRKIAIEVFHT
jgi:hypothetical protein